MLNGQSECKQMRGDVRMRRRMYAELGYGGRGVACKSSPLNDVSIFALESRVSADESQSEQMRRR